MPVEFLSDEQAAAYGRFGGPPSQAELEGFFFLDDMARELVDRRRGDHNRLGFAVQLGTLRFLGTFLADPLEVPWAVVEYLGPQLGVADVSVVKAYAERPATQWEHAAELRRAYGYVDMTVAEERLRSFLAARAWTRAERPSALFDQAVAWLRIERVLLPGVSVLAGLVVAVRAEASTRLHEALAGQVDGGLGARLEDLLRVADGERFSELDRFRRAPTRVSGREMARALDRAGEVAAIGAGAVDVAEVPPGRVEVLARQGLTSDVWSLRRLSPARRAATLVATVRASQVASVDDALDLFAALMASKLIGPAERAAVKDRLRTLPQLRKASHTLAAAVRTLLAVAEDAGGGPADLATVWTALEAVAPRDRLAAAVATVEELAPADAEDLDAGTRAELVSRYGSVRLFLPTLTEVLPLRATDAGTAVLAAARTLPDLAGRRRVRREEIDEQLVTGSWRRLVFADPDLPEGAVDHRAYTLCVLDGLYRALRRRDVYAIGGSRRWGDPRARLLDGPAWEQTRPQVLTALRLTEPPSTHLSDLARQLDAAYTGLAARLGPPEERDTDTPVRLEPSADGRMRLHLARLEALDEPASLAALRDLVASMLPRVDLPEVLLEVDAWTGYLGEFSHVAESGTRMDDLATSLAGVNRTGSPGGCVGYATSGVGVTV